MQWLLLFIAGLLEVSWAIGLKSSVGFTRPMVSLLTVICLGASVFFLSLSLTTLPLSLAYAVWTGIGTMGTIAVGTMWFGERLAPPQLLFILMILVGIIGLKLVST